MPLAVLVAGCASGGAQKRGSRSAPADPSDWRDTGPAAAVTDDEAVGLQMSLGVLDERSVDRALAAHRDSLAGCFVLAGEARKYLSGRVVLRFVVTPLGQVSEIHVVKNELGSFPVECCLVAKGRQIRMPRPEGNRGTDFEFPLDFRSSGEVPVLDWSGAELAARVGERARDFAACGPLGPRRVDAVAYIVEDGSIGSVGFVSQGPVDPVAGLCAASVLGRLRLTEARPAVALRVVVPVGRWAPLARIEGRHLVKRSRRR